MFFIAVIAVLGMFGAITGAVASARGHGFWPFFFLGALISPVLGIILTFIISPPRKTRTRRVVRRVAKAPSRGTQRRTNSQNPYEAPSR
jgi:hypothetical protein